MQGSGTTSTWQILCPRGLVFGRHVKILWKAPTGKELRGPGKGKGPEFWQSETRALAMGEGERARQLGWLMGHNRESPGQSRPREGNKSKIELPA